MKIVETVEGIAINLKKIPLQRRRKCGGEGAIGYRSRAEERVRPDVALAAALRSEYVRP